jgi:3-phosphoglycerate kinase
MRADYSVPVKNGQVLSDFRIKQSLPIIKYILSQPGTSMVIISHLGRPKLNDKQFSLEPVAKHLSELLGKKVNFVDDCIGDKVKKATSELKPGEILLLENLRFHDGEKQNDRGFAKAIVDSTQANIFVQDGFGVAHREHASTEAITKLLPSVAGLLLEKEIKTITNVMQSPKRPLLAIVGGAKISDKIGLLNSLIDIADCVAVAGGMANNFLLAEGEKLGKSLIEPSVLDITKEILAKARQKEDEQSFKFLIPVDSVVSTAMDGTKPTRRVDLAKDLLTDGEMILDIGPNSAKRITDEIKKAKTVIWNGTCGVTETEGRTGMPGPFTHGTKTIVEAMIGLGHSVNNPFVLVGGGDTVSYIESQDLLDNFDYISTGGGAYLDLLAGKKLPAVEALLDKNK